MDLLEESLKEAGACRPGLYVRGSEMGEILITEMICGLTNNHTLGEMAFIAK
jgi:hypothetical protein